MIGSITVTLMIVLCALIYWRQHIKETNKNKNACLVWVNLYIIHNKSIDYVSIADFVEKKISKDHIEEQIYYRNYIKELAGKYYNTIYSE